MLGENKERMLKSTPKQFSESVRANREKGTFSSQLESNPKFGTSSGSASDIFRKVNAIITLRFEKKD